MAEAYLSIRNVIKQYDGHQALKGVSFDVPKGSVFGLLGPNGAGKTSLIRIITNITRADEGEVLLDGVNTRDVPRGRIGYMPEERGLYKKMKIYEQLMYFGELRGMDKRVAHEKIKYWLDKMGLSNWYNKTIEELSKGMQQKIQFVATVMHDPGFLILDEPFSGLDPVNTELLKNEILELNKQGTTLMFSTHRMEQVEEICDRIVLISAGANVLEGNVKDVKDLKKGNIYEVKFENPLQSDLLPSGVSIVSSHHDAITLHAPDRHQLNLLIRDEMQRGNDLVALKEILPTLNEIFINTVRQQHAMAD